MKRESPPAPPPRLIIEGANMTGVSSFYAEINRVFMADEDWQLGPSLDALDDMLYGGYGALREAGSTILLWRDMDASRAALGVEETRRFYRERMAQRPMFNGSAVVDLLEALERGEGRTYFDIVIEIFAAHPEIRLVAA